MSFRGSLKGKLMGFCTGLGLLLIYLEFIVEQGTAS